MKKWWRHTESYPSKVLWQGAIKDFDTNFQHGNVESVYPSVRLVHYSNFIIATRSYMVVPWRYGRTHHTPHDEHTYYMYWSVLVSTLCKCLRHTRDGLNWCEINLAYVTTLIVHLSQEERSKNKLVYIGCVHLASLGRPRCVTVFFPPGRMWVIICTRSSWKKKTPGSTQGS